MDEDHAEHRVSTKIALFSHDLKKVLIMRYPTRGALSGLPGGHLEKDEQPDETLVRELQEELGVTINNFEKRSFFIRADRGSSVILAYVGVADEGIVLAPPNPAKEFGEWVTRQELERVENILPAYKVFITENWPTK